MACAQLIDCDRGPPLYDLGCDGGNFEGGILYIAENGVDTEADYPYIAKDSKCRRAWLTLLVGTWLLTRCYQVQAVASECACVQNQTWMYTCQLGMSQWKGVATAPWNPPESVLKRCYQLQAVYLQVHVSRNRSDVCLLIWYVAEEGVATFSICAAQ